LNELQNRGLDEVAGGAEIVDFVHVSAWDNLVIGVPADPCYRCDEFLRACQNGWIDLFMLGDDEKYRRNSGMDVV
jgi:hypothetical protein